MMTSTRAITRACAARLPVLASLACAAPAAHAGTNACVTSSYYATPSRAAGLPNCTTTSTTFYSYIPRNATGSLDYCIVRDLYPYNYTAWRSQCTGE